MSTTDLIASADAHINSLNPTSNFNTILYTGYSAAPTVARAFFTFDLSSIGSDEISAGTLKLTVKTDYASFAHTLNIFRVLRNWVETQMTWNIYSTGNSWTTAGCGSDGNDYVNTILGSGSIGASEGVNTQLSFDFNATGITILNQMRTGTINNYGFMCKVDNEAQVNLYEWYYNGTATTAYKPTLTVTHAAGTPSTFIPKVILF